MATGRRIRSNFQRGTITDSPLASGSTTINSAAFASLPAVASNHLILVLDPTASAGAPEIVEVTAHTAAATSVTVARGAEGSAARQHASGITWILAPTFNDYVEIVTSATRPTVGLYEGKLIYETDTDKVYFYNTVDWSLVSAGGQLGYAQVVAQQTGITTVVDLTTLTATVTVPTNTRVKVTGHCMIQSSVADDIARLSIQEGAAVLQLAQMLCRPAATSTTHHVEYVATPTAGSHTYKLTLARVSGTGTLIMDAGATYPAFILVEDIGSSL
jgi:hypothetical protein